MRSRPFGPKRTGLRARSTRPRLDVERMEPRQLLATFTVMNTSDSGPGSLRDAIISANGSAGTDSINFNITGTGVQTITPLSPLPAISEGLVIDATTQPGTTTTPLIELSGSMAGASASGLTITASGVTVRGLAIDRFSGSGIAISGAGGNTIQNNFIGTDPTGAASASNGIGISISGSPSNIIGGTTSTARNVISGNTTAGIQITGAASTTNLVQGNLIGTDLGGSTALGNGTGVIIAGDGSTTSGARSNTIGGTAAGARNTIAGNTNQGILIRDAGASGNTVQNNLIGTNSSGTAPLGNGIGVEVSNGSGSNTVGGLATGALNVISGNTSRNVLLDSTSNNLVAGNNIGTNLIGDAAIRGGTSTSSPVGIFIDNGSTGNTIGGTSSSARNLIAGIAGDGIAVRGRVGTTGSVSSGNLIQGNLIGTGGSGLTALPNTGNGITLLSGAASNTIGGTATGARNVIAGNAGDGVNIRDTGTDNNVLQGNLIGVGLGGTTSGVANLFGVLINGGSNNTIGGTATGAGNTVAFNTQDGVEVQAGNGNAIQRNSIFQNGGLGINLTGTGNNSQTAPIISGVITSSSSGTTTTTVNGRLASTPSSSFTIDFYTNGTDALSASEGRTWVGSTTVTTDAAGNANFSFPLPTSASIGTVITATATNTTTHNTSEFSQGVANTAPTADLNVLITSVTPNPALQNSPLVYTIVVGNLGPVQATNVTLTDTLPTNAQFLNATSTVGSVNQSGSTVTATIGTLAAGATATITVTVTPTSATALTNTARATATESDPNQGNNTATTTTQVTATANDQVSVAATPSPASVNNNLAYTFTVTNNGSATSTNTNLAVTLPANATFVSASPSQGSASGTGNVLTFNLGSLAAGAAATATVVIQPTSTGNATALGVVTADNLPSPNPNGLAYSGVVVNATPTTPTSTTPPTVTSLARAGYHNQQTTFAVTFSEDMDQASAQDLANYTIVAAGRDGRLGTADDVPIDLRSAVYDTTTRTVTLTPIRRTVPLGTRLRLTVSGTSPRGLKNTGGIFLDGNNDGTAGGDYTANFSGYGSGPNGPQAGTVPAQTASYNSYSTTDTRVLNHVDRVQTAFGKTRDRA